MTEYARIVNGVIASRRAHPTDVERIAGRDWDFRNPDVWDAWRVANGWVPIVDTPRPADTAETTSDPAPPALIDGVPVQQWTIRPWTPEELAAQAEAAAYEAQQAVDRAILDATAALMADAHTDGEAWVQPVAAHNAYAKGITVTHNGKTWESLTPANVWTPGVSGWREVVVEGYPAWTQPTGVHDAHNAGDRVTFEGADYESLIAGNVWSPAAYPQGWRKL